MKSLIYYEEIQCEVCRHTVQKRDSYVNDMGEHECVWCLKDREERDEDKP